MDRYKIWSKEEEKLLIKLRNEGIPNKEIGFRLGRTRFSVWKKLDSLGLINGTGKKPKVSTSKEKVRAYQFRSLQEKTAFEVMLAAITAVEQAMNQIVKSKDQHNVHIS